MKRWSLALTFVLGFVLGGLAFNGVLNRPVQAQQLLMPDHVRFRLAGDEPIATPDGRSFINNWKIVVLRDVKSDQCYTVFLVGSAMSATGPTTCPS